jgi:hypothetical protein
MMETRAIFFYGFEFLGSKRTTTGEPNKRTGKMSIAGTVRAFRNTRELARWVDAAKPGRERLEVKLPRLRVLLAGMTMEEFAEALRAAKFDADQCELFD